MIHNMIVRAVIEGDVAEEDGVHITAEAYNEKLQAEGCLRSDSYARSAGETDDREVEEGYDEII